MGSTELAANLFRATQTEEKLRKEKIHLFIWGRKNEIFFGRESTSQRESTNRLLSPKWAFISNPRFQAWESSQLCDLVGGETSAFRDHLNWDEVSLHFKDYFLFFFFLPFFLPFFASNLLFSLLGVEKTCGIT